MGLGLESFQWLLECRSPGALAQRAAVIAGKLGVQNWLYASDRAAPEASTQRLVLGDYPDGWLRHYLEAEYLQCDPVVAHCRRHATPIAWEQARQGSLRAGERGRRARTMFEEAGEFGLADGLSVPLHGPGIGWGVVSFAAREIEPGQFQQVAAELFLLAQFLHESALALDRSSGEVAQPRLTPRELECLNWAGIGKTSWEIGRLLALSERTVVFHLQNASRKLGVCNRQAAVAKAISLGLIAPI